MAAPAPARARALPNIHFGWYRPKRMAKLVQIKDVPEDVHRVLKSRAALAGLSLNEYLRQELTKFAQRPSPEELGRMLDAIEPAHMTWDPVEILRELRDES
jgi:hypothetical protein